MKTVLSIFCSALLLCGCSQKHTSYIDDTIDVVTGKDIVVGNYVLNVKKREGDSLEGVRIVQRAPDGKETTITADTGTITEGPKRSIESPATNLQNQSRPKVAVIQKAVKVTLINASVQTNAQTGPTQMTVERLEINLQLP
jgi:hypothetical protein